MPSQKPTTGRHVDADGVTRIQSPRTGGGTWLVGLALGFTVLCLLLSAWLVRSPGTATEGNDESPAPPEHVPPQTSAPLQGSPRPAARPIAQQQAPATPPEPRPEPQPETPAMTQDARSSGPAEGLDLYRPGTKPLKQGIIVPEDFELPPGYMRHYQTTDNGQMQKPILMFHPDYKPMDPNGRPIELPPNRVVPPEMAPPGMPLDILEPPEGPEGVEPLP